MDKFTDENPLNEILLEMDAVEAPDWLSDEDCLHEIGSDWSRRHCESGDGE